MVVIIVEWNGEKKWEGRDKKRGSGEAKIHNSKDFEKKKYKSFGTMDFHFPASPFLN